MRIVKKHDERRNEILDVAERLFYAKGYERCTVNDILNETAIAKGTFYHYFKSKEDVMDAILSRYIDMMASNVEEILHQKDMEADEKLMNAFLAMRIGDRIDDDTMNGLHKVENALLHQKLLNRMIGYMAPVLVKIIEEGIETKRWRCDYPLQSMQIFLAASLSLTDEGIFELEADSQLKIMAALISTLEKMLDAQEGSFLQMYSKIN